MQQALMIAPSRPTPPAASRHHFGLGTIASPCGNPAYRKSPEGRTYCEREAELERQAEAWTEVYRKLGINPTSVRPSDAELRVLARAASEMGDDLPVRTSPPLITPMPPWQTLMPAAALLLALPAAIFLLGRASG